MRIRDRARSPTVLRFPLVRTRRALGQLPLVAEEGLEVAHVPRCRSWRPRAFQAASDCVQARARFKAVLPAEPLVLDASTLGLRAHMRGRSSAVRLAERVAAC